MKLMILLSVLLFAGLCLTGFGLYQAWLGNTNAALLYIGSPVAVCFAVLFFSIVHEIPNEFRSMIQEKAQKIRDEEKIGTEEKVTAFPKRNVI